ncbi:hypothetical protein EGV01_09365 [Pseudomonas syringae pv. theae]|nr:hypothetical protein [Pseudomonas syringae pv. theae]
MAHLSLGAQQLHHQPGAALELEALGGRIAITAGEQVFAGFLAPGDGEVLMHIVKNGPGQHARNVLTRQKATRSEIGFRLVALFTVQCRVLVGVPILVQRVMAHDKADRAGQFIIDQHAFLVVRGTGAHGKANIRVSTRIIWLPYLIRWGA